MQKSFFVRSLASVSALVFTASFIAPAFGDSSTAAYKEQLRAYREKLLAYQVQPGRLQEQRKEICLRLKNCTSSKQNVDALWAKFDALERRARGTDSAYATEVKALATEVKNKEAELNAISDKSVSKDALDATIESQSAKKSSSAAATADFFRDCAPRSGMQFNRRKRIFEELQRCHREGKGIAIHIQQYLKMDNALLSGSSSLDAMLTQLEDSLGLQHTVKD